MHYFLIAGEASGDLHGAGLIKALGRADAQARFTVIGGDLMAAAAGHQDSGPLIHYRRMAFMGFSEVLRHAGDIRRNFRVAREALRERRPDALVLIDYPGFNLRMARTAHSLGIPVFYYIPPKLWAWKGWRVRAMRRDVDSALCIFPFEVDWYRAHGYERAVYVGNPTVAEVDQRLAVLETWEEFCSRWKLRSHRLVLALVPGSRAGEVRNNLPVMLAAAAQFPQYTPVVAAAPGLDDQLYRALAPGVTLARDDTFSLMAHARGAMVTSGTATLECALAGTPQVACYRANGSRLSYRLMSLLIHVPYVTLPNLVADAPVIPELLLHQCTPDAVAAQLARLLPAGEARRAQLDGYALIRQRLGTSDAAAKAAEIIIPKTETQTQTQTQK